MSNMMLALSPNGEDPGVYGPDKANYSPANAQRGSDVAGPTGVPFPVANHRVPVNAAGPYPFAAHTVPPPPDPSIGGEAGPLRQLGWSDGIRPIRWAHQLFTGMAVRAPSNRPNPRTGDVGYRDWSGRRAAGVNALLTDRTPTSEAVAAAFGYTVKRNAISDEVTAVR